MGDKIGEEVVELATKFNVSTLPTFLHLVDGQVVGQISGFKQLTQLETDLKLAEIVANLYEQIC